MDKKEILKHLIDESDRVRLVKDPNYEHEFPDQCFSIELDGEKTRFFKCLLCPGLKGVITCGERNTKDSIKKHRDRAHGANLFSSGGVKRPNLVDQSPADQKKLKTISARFQVGQLDSDLKNEFQQAIAVWQAKCDIPMNAISNEEFNEVLIKLAGQ